MTKKISIAYLIDTICTDKAGTQKQLIGIIKRMDRELFNVTLVCLYESPWMAHNHLPCKVISLGYRGFLKPNFPLVLIRYLRILNVIRFDVVQTFFEDAIFVGFLGKILSAHKHSLVISKRDLGLGAEQPNYHLLYKKVMPFVMSYVDAIATNAATIKQQLIEEGIFPRCKIQVIGNGVDFKVKVHEPPPLFKNYQADLWIGLVANLQPIKRIDIFLRALAYYMANEKGCCVRAVILGDGRLMSELVQLAVELGIYERVHFMGAIGNVNDYIHHLDVGVICSDNEGLSNAVLEYMTCGLPVVVTSVGGNRELVDNTNGFIVQAGDYEALGKALIQLGSSSKLRKQLGNKSLEKVQTEFSWKKIMLQWESFYKLLIVK